MKAKAITVGTAWGGLRDLLSYIVVISAFMFGAIACTSTTTTTTSNRGSAGIVHSAHVGQAKLELNQGKKWVVAPPMMAHIHNLERQVHDFERAPAMDHTVAAQSIQENLGRFVTNCTMEGPAHDELHKWLMPFLGASAEYSKATDPQVQQAKLQEIKESLHLFHSYFE